MPGVTVLPNSPGLGSFGSPQLATQNGAGAQYDGLNAIGIKEKAIEAVQKESRGFSSLTYIRTARTQYTMGRESENKGDLKASLAAYVKAASLARTAIESPDNQKGSPLWKEIGEFWKIHAEDLGDRLKAVEEKLKAIEKAAPHASEQSEGPITKPGGSIIDRVKALQENGLSVATTKRLSRTISEQPTSPQPISTRVSTPPTALVTLVPPAPASSASSPHTLVSPSSFGPPSPPSTPSSSPQLNAFDLTGFTQAFPSIKELDESPAFNLPSVPTNITGMSQSKDVRNGESSQSSSPIVSNITASTERSSSTPISPPANAFSSRPGSPTKPSLPRKPSGLSLHPSPVPNQVSPKPLIPVSGTTTPSELAKYLQRHKVLLLDVRNRADFEREHIRSGAAIACVEPAVLQRKNLTLDRLEVSMLSAPVHDQSVFANRDKFDLVVIYDDDSTSLGPSDSPISVLNRLISEQSIQKMLKRQPMLLLGGLNAWRHEFGGSVLSNGAGPDVQPVLSPSSSSLSSTNLRNPFYINGTSAAPSSISPSPLGSPFHRSNMSLDQNPSHSRSPAEAAYPTTLPPPNGLTRRPALVRPSSSSISYTRSFDSIGSTSQSLSNTPSSPFTYPSLSRNTTPAAPGSGSPFFPASLPHHDIMEPPQASINPSQLSRKRTDYIDQSQEAISGLHNRTTIDYPELSSPQVLRPPPAAAPSTLERQDNRPRPLPFSPTAPDPPRIPSDYPATYWFDSPINVSGLQNLGNTCYMNAPIQCLSATVPFAKFFKEGRWKTAINLINPLGSKGKLVTAFSQLLLRMWDSREAYFSPHEFRQTICSLKSQYRGSDQHDSQEFLSFLLDGIHEDFNRILSKEPWVPTAEHEAALERLPVQIASDQEWTIWRRRNDSLIVDFFQGQFRNRLQCYTCETTSTTYNVFSILQLPIPRGKKGRVALRDCLDAFFDTEVLEGDDAWDCPKCKMKRKASKTLSLARLPPILLIHLKRFATNSTTSNKIDTFVDFPMKALDLTNYMPPPLPQAVDRRNPGIPTSLEDPRTQMPPYRYDLYGVTNHSGTLTQGHYTATIASRGGWVNCDDSVITPTDPKSVVSEKAYVLFYKRTKA
ncbi:putative peptidase C19 family protein [Lyophyllum shimeji]|uniref:ubiquitinyl hydrolase 1 n=1 Tax=Lyophyllum shimeji TaxID=47721 RepID=A0A9P3UNH8_LYOSH|nr:putative peptidase C19 family protein [Lyophyllum shimeji]